MKKLSDLRNVGKATLEDLRLLQIHSVEELARQDATNLFQELEKRPQKRQDPCIWDVFAAIIHLTPTLKSLYHSAVNRWSEMTNVGNNQALNPSLLFRGFLR